MAGEDTAGAVRQRGPRARHLPVTALAAQLAHGLHQQQHTELSGMAIGQPPPVLCGVVTCRLSPGAAKPSASIPSGTEMVNESYS